MTRPDDADNADNADNAEAREQSIRTGGSAQDSSDTSRDLAGPGPHGDQEEDPDT
ncbi:hypothetical protein ACRS6B_14335 [Nocardia asteroides]